MFTKLTEWWSGGFKKRAALVGSLLIFVLLVAGLLTFYFPSAIPPLPGLFSPAPPVDPFEGFTKLDVNRTDVPDNYNLKAVLSDSIGVDPASTYVLTSKDEVATADIKSNLKISPEVDYALTKTADKEWELQLVKPLAPNTIFKVALASTYTDKDGNEQARNYDWSFQVKDTFKVLHSIPRDAATSVNVRTGIEITFSYENFTDYDKYFSIEPNVSGRFKKHGRTLVFVPDELAQGQVYTVTMKKGLPLTDSQETLGQDYTFAFETENRTSPSSPNAPWLSAYQKLQDVSTTDAPLIQLSARNLPDNTVHVSVYPLHGEEEYLQMLRKRDQTPWWAYSKDNYVTDTSNRQPLTSFQVPVADESNVQYIRFPQTLPAGYYVADITNGDLRDQVWIQVTDAAAYVNVANNKTVIWVADLSNKQPVGSARVELLGTNNRYVTNSQGIALFNTPAELISASSDINDNTRPYFKISYGGKELIIAASYLSHGYSYTQDNTPAEYWKYLYSDRPLYQPTDTIKYWGLLKPRDNGSINDKVTLTLYKEGYVDYYYRPVVVDQQTLQVDNFGTFTGQMSIKDLRADTYSLELRVGDHVIERKYIEIRPYTKPAYQLSLIPDKKIEFAGNEIKLEAQASFFEGTPVPDLPLVFETPEGKQTVTTDDQGKVELTYTKQYSDCNRTYNCWPSYSWLKISPEQSELAEITGNAYMRFYGPNIYATAKVTYPDKGQAQVAITARQIDLAKAENGGNIWQDGGLGSVPSAGTKIEGEVTKITYTRTEKETRYDFINKKTYKTYSVQTHEDKVDGFSGTTDSNGQYIYTRDVESNTSYRVKVKYYDTNGRYDVTTYYLYYYDGASLNQYSGEGNNFYRLKLPDSNKFSVGDQVAVDFVNNDISLPDGGSNYYLFMQYQNGFQEYDMTQNSDYTFPFETRDIPNVNLSAVYFNGSSFIVAETGWTGNSILFNTADKTLDIQVVPDKTQYQPGDKVKLSIATHDALGRPVSAAVNLNLIDEAFYAVMDSQANPIDTIYAGISSGTIYSGYSHRLPINPYGGAEKGGCFLAGTKILMADGSLKNIEDIQTGDQILTLADPRDSTKVVGTVTELYQHVISNYLVINGQLRVTPEHLVYANLQFKPAGDLKVGDWMLKSDGSKITVTSIEVKHEIVPVYNFKVDPQHTFFADGYFVHNEKGGGPREFFTDAALFETVTTNSNGQAYTSFTLPDNVTSWRVTAQGLSSSLAVGLSVSKIPVSLPVFVEATVGKTYIAGDQPIVRLRSFGTALTRNDPVMLSLLSPDLGIANPQTKQATAYQSEFFPLPRLSSGTYDLTYAVDSAKGKDAVKLPLTVLDSRITVQSATTQDATAGLTITNTANQPMAVLISDKQRSTVYNTLRQLSWSWGDRIDQGLARTMSQQILNDTFGYSYPVPDFAAAQYQMPSGGLTLLPYSSEDLELSAEIAALHYSGFDESSLNHYFFNKLEDASSTREEISLSLYGLAALQQPVLPRVKAWLQRDDLTVKEKLYLALAAYALGDGEQARSIYYDIVSQYAQTKSPHIIIRAGDTYDEVLNNTSLTAVLAAYLNQPEQYGLMDYLRYHHPKEILLYLDELNFAKANLASLVDKNANVELVLNGKDITATLSRPRFTYALEMKANDTLRVATSAPDMVITTNLTVPLAQSGLSMDSDIGIRREYYVNGQQTNTFHENDLVEVRLYPELKGNALDGSYQITDILPSGLLPVTKLYSGGHNDCTYWTPYRQGDQQVKYMLNKSWWAQHCAPVIRYYARVKTKGTYTAEPAVIQSMLNPDFINISSEDQVQIQ